MSIWVAEFCKREYVGFIEAGGIVEKLVLEAIRRVYEGRRGELEGEEGWEDQLKVLERAKAGFFGGFVEKAKRDYETRVEGKGLTWAQVVGLSLQ